MDSEHQTGFSVASTKINFLVADGIQEEADNIKRMIIRIHGEGCAVYCCEDVEGLGHFLKEADFEALVIADNLKDLVHDSILKTIEYVEVLTPHLPVIVIADHYDAKYAIETISSGAQEYLIKCDLSTDLLSRSLHYSIERKQSQIKLKKALDAASQKNLQLEKLARYDFLTGLPNRAYFEATAIKHLLRAARQGKQLALIYFDVNKFKKINDSYGHSCGDELLRQITYRVKNCLRKTEFFARLGGDEFAIVTDLIDKKSDIYPLVNRILSGFQPVFTLGRYEVNAQTAIGISYYPDALTLESLLKQADIAMYQAKKNTENPLCFFSNDMQSSHFRAMQIESLLQEGFDNQEFFSKFQPVYAKTGELTNRLEALLHWQSSHLGLITPPEFIPLIENGPAINDATRFVANDCGKVITGNSQDFTNVHINIFTKQLSNQKFSEQFLFWLEQANIDKSQVCLEINESDMVANYNTCSDQLQALQKLGITIALDNFGKGLSSTQLLLKLPVDYLKLDRELVRKINQYPRTITFSKCIIEFCHACDIKVIAQGVETKEEFDTLVDLNCDYFQGYYFSKLLKAEELNQANGGMVQSVTV